MLNISRWNTNRIVMGLALSTILHVSGNTLFLAAADSPPSTQVAIWKAPEVIQTEALDPQSISLTPSPSGSAATLLLNKFKVSLGNEQDSLSSISTIHLRLPIKLGSAQKEAHISTDLRGYLNKDKGSRVVLLCDVGGATKSIVFPYGKTRVVDQMTLSLKRTSTILGQQYYLVSITAIVQRKAPQNFVELQLDSLDFGLKVK